METPGTTVRSSVDVAGGPRETFERLVDELGWALDPAGFELDDGPDGRIVHGGHEVGRVTAWEPGEAVRFEWRPAPWEPGVTTELALRFEATDGGTRITLEHGGWDRLIEEESDAIGWFASAVLVPHVVATSPDSFGDWLTDRGARRPAGAAARDQYGDPLYHYPNFRVILSELALTPEDHLLEVGCGGGALLSEALESGCRAAAVDHSPEMVRLARRANREAVEAGRLDVREADAGELPFPDGTFTCATMTGVLGHLPDPAAAFDEIYRVLDDGGRIVVLGSDPELEGTPAAPEPMASRMRFYESEELEALAREAGFEAVRVVRHTLESHARAVGVPEAHLPLFEYPSRFLLARKAVGPRGD